MKAYIISLGCPKNLTDTENLMSKLAEEGYTFTNKPAQADLILVNTCAFIKSAKDESINILKEMSLWKKKGKCKHLIVAGCLPQREKNKLPKLLPYVDAFIGTPQKFQPPQKTIIQATPPWYAYVKIAEGCNNCCSYCTIPSIRGKLRSRPVKDILAEVNTLANNGVKEIIFVAQDTTAHPKFVDIIRKTAKIKKIKWIRIMYAHPAHVTDKLINLIAKEKKIVKYLDLPIQHACDKILKRMKRRYSRQDLNILIARIRRKIPKIALRTSVIVGFPGESETESKELADFLKEVKFDKLGVFTYSKEVGTPAAKLRAQVSEKRKKKRLNHLMRQQARISRERNKKLIGKTLNIIIEGAKGSQYIGRAYFDAPDIDGLVFVSSNKTLTPGQIVRSHITKAKTYDLIGCCP